MSWRFDNTYARDLAGLYAPWQPTPAPAPTWLRFNTPLADELGLDSARLAGPEGLAVFSGQVVPDGAQPIAQAYAGHQFGGFSPQLGDGRALLLGEVLDRQGQRRDIAFKGSGRTPFSRGGDGKAAVGPVLREYLMGEAMHALGVPTTRVLAAVATGETVRRERALPGAVLTRVAASHIRVGTFEWLANRQDTEGLRRLADHTIARHDPDLINHPDRYLALVERVQDRQAQLVARWMGLGFVHGVMNTDNMALSGETIDFGPCAMLETHDPATVFSSIDHGGRYAYGNQPGIAQWNLARLAEALLPLMGPDTDAAVERATALINTYPDTYARHWTGVMRHKLGLDQRDAAPDATADTALATDLLDLMTEQRVDHTLGFRHLAAVLRGDPGKWLALFGQAMVPAHAWLVRWQSRLGTSDEASPTKAAEVADRLDRTNPLHVPRNHLVEEALAAATDHQNLDLFERLLTAVTQPYETGTNPTRYGQPASAAESAGYRTFCGT